MEPVTHVLTGMCLSRCGPHRSLRYATVAMAIAAELPDIDVLWGLRGPVSGFEHHRGITHTLVGIPFEAAFLVLLLYLFDSAQRRRSHLAEPAHSRPQLPLRLGALFGFTFVALLSHLLLDYTNNYGLRPFFPFNAKWYAASIVFIFDPVIFILLLAGLVLPWLFSLINQEISGRQKEPASPAWAMAALLGVFLIWCFRAYEHGKAIDLGSTQAIRQPAQIATPEVGMQGAAVNAAPVHRPLLTPQRTWASPDPLNPFRWYLVNDFGPVYTTSVADTKTGALDLGQTLEKTADSPPLLRAKESRLGRIYLDWSAMPLVRVAPLHMANSDETSVLFKDLRFAGGPTFLQRDSEPPLTGEVRLNSAGHVLAEGINGRFGR